jgi:hypothetical protein
MLEPTRICILLLTADDPGEVAPASCYAMHDEESSGRLLALPCSAAASTRKQRVTGIRRTNLVVAIVFT